MNRFNPDKKIDTAALYKMPKIKVVYIHGMESKPLPEKTKIMEQAGFEVFALHLDYMRDKNVYAKLKELILDKEADFIIGSSYGGMLAYYLSEELGIPCLVFNPAIRGVQDDAPKLKKLNCPLRMVVLGEKDDIINPVKNKEFFKEKEREDLKQKVLSCSWLGHSIDFQTFEEMCFLATRNYSIWKLTNNSNV